MPITDTWQEWSTSAASNPPAGTAVPLMDDEIRNIKAEIIKNAVDLTTNQTIAGEKIFSDLVTFSSGVSLPSGSTFASGTKLPFYQATAPAGWTQDTAVNDKVLRVVSGAGAGTGGNWTLSGMAVDGHAISVDEMPSHDHTLGVIASGNAGSSANIPLIAGTTTHTSNTGGGATHTHGLTNTSWRPAYIDVIVCAKD